MLRNGCATPHAHSWGTATRNNARPRTTETRRASPAETAPHASAGTGAAPRLVVRAAAGAAGGGVDDAGGGHLPGRFGRVGLAQNDRGQLRFRAGARAARTPGARAGYRRRGHRGRVRLARRLLEVFHPPAVDGDLAATAGVAVEKLLLGAFLDCRGGGRRPVPGAGRGQGSMTPAWSDEASRVGVPANLAS